MRRAWRLLNTLNSQNGLAAKSVNHWRRTEALLGPQKDFREGFTEVLGLASEQEQKREMAASIGGGRSTFLRSIRRISRNSTASSPSISPNFMLRHTPVSSPRPSSSSRFASFLFFLFNQFWIFLIILTHHSLLVLVRWLPRQLSSLLPVHSAIASACLVSNLPAEPTTSIQGSPLFSLYSFANW